MKSEKFKREIIKFQISVSKELLDVFREYAARDGLSVNATIINAMRFYVNTENSLKMAGQLKEIIQEKIDQGNKKNAG